MLAMPQPGCPGTAARLPIKPGNQKPTPPASACAAVDGIVMAPNAAAPAKACLDHERRLEELIMRAPATIKWPTRLERRKAHTSPLLWLRNVGAQTSCGCDKNATQRTRMGQST